MANCDIEVEIGIDVLSSYKANDVDHWTRHDIMFRLTLGDSGFIGLCLEGFFYGLYSGIFAMYIQYHGRRKDTNNTQNIVFYSISILYVLSIAAFVCDIADITFQLVSKPSITIHFIQGTLFACCDSIAQFILIYRCWIVWGRNIRVVIIPSILTVVFLGTWLAATGSLRTSSGILALEWEPSIVLTGLALSLTVNALVMGLIVFRIFKIFQEVKATSDDRILGATGGGKLRRIMFILIESGMALFSIQLARLVVTIVGLPAAVRAFNIIAGIHEMLSGITPTIILVRTSMGLSFDDEKSMEEFAIESLRFVSNHQNSIPETGIIGIVEQDGRNDDDIGIQQSNEIEVVER